MVQYFEWDCWQNQKTRRIIYHLGQEIEAIEAQVAELYKRNKKIKGEILDLQATVQEHRSERDRGTYGNRIEFLSETLEGIVEQRRWDELKDDMIETRLSEAVFQRNRLMRATVPLEDCLENSVC